MRHTQVNADLTLSHWQGLGLLSLAREDGIPLARLILDGTGFDGAWKWTMQGDLDGADFREAHSSSWGRAETYRLFSSVLLSFYIAFERFQGDASDCSHKITVCPQARQLALELWELLTQRAATCALDVLDEPMDTELRVTSDQQMHMIGHDFQLNELLSPCLNRFPNESFQSLIYRCNQHLAPILGTKHYMIMADVCDVVSRLQFVLHERRRVG